MNLFSPDAVKAAGFFNLTGCRSRSLADGMINAVAIHKSEYGIDLKAASVQTHHLLPHPAVFVVDARGVIRFAHVNPDYKIRLEPEKILEAIRRTNTAEQCIDECFFRENGIKRPLAHLIFQPCTASISKTWWIRSTSRSTVLG